MKFAFIVWLVHAVTTLNLPYSELLWACIIAPIAGLIIYFAVKTGTYDEDTNQKNVQTLKEYTEKFAFAKMYKWLVIATVTCGILNWAAPSEKVAYTMVGAYIAQQGYENCQKDDTICNEALDSIYNFLKEGNEDAEEAREMFDQARESAQNAVKTVEDTANSVKEAAQKATDAVSADPSAAVDTAIEKAGEMVKSVDSEAINGTIKKATEAVQSVDTAAINETVANAQELVEAVDTQVKSVTATQAAN